MRAAFFDMDKTLVRVNTGRLYVRWRFARRRVLTDDFAPSSLFAPSAPGEGARRLET